MNEDSDSKVIHLSNDLHAEMLDEKELSLSSLPPGESILTIARQIGRGLANRQIIAEIEELRSTQREREQQFKHQLAQVMGDSAERIGLLTSAIDYQRSLVDGIGNRQLDNIERASLGANAGSFIAGIGNAHRYNMSINALAVESAHNQRVEDLRAGLINLSNTVKNLYLLPQAILDAAQAAVKDTPTIAHRNESLPETRSVAQVDYEIDHIPDQVLFAELQRRFSSKRGPKEKTDWPYIKVVALWEDWQKAKGTVTAHRFLADYRWSDNGSRISEPSYMYKLFRYWKLPVDSRRKKRGH